MSQEIVLRVHKLIKRKLGIDVPIKVLVVCNEAGRRLAHTLPESADMNPAKFLRNRSIMKRASLQANKIEPKFGNIV